MSLVSSYDSSLSRLTVYLGKETFVYADVSPFHHDRFKERRNKGYAMAYLRKQGFRILDLCPVCGREHLDTHDICGTCGWQEDPSATDHPDLCDGGPNWAPLNIIRKRWKDGERDREVLGRCPMPFPNCRECPYDAFPEIRLEPLDDQETG